MHWTIPPSPEYVGNIGVLGETGLHFCLACFKQSPNEYGQRIASVMKVMDFGATVLEPKCSRHVLIILIL